MALDLEPTNNTAAGADPLGLLSAAGDGAINRILGPRKVQSMTAATLDGYTVSAPIKDAMDHVSMQVGADVQSVRFLPGLIPVPSIDGARVVGAITHVEYRPGGAFGGSPIVIEARVGLSRFKEQAVVTESAAIAVANQMVAVAANDIYVRADYERLRHIYQDLWRQLGEFGGVNVNMMQALQIGQQIRAKVAEGGSSMFASQVNTLGLQFASMVENWHRVQFTLDTGAGPRVVSEVELTSFRWTAAGGAPGFVSIAGYTGTLSSVGSVLDNSTSGRYNISPLDVSGAEVHVETFTNGAVAKIGTNGDENVEGDYFAKNVVYGLKGADRMYGGQYDDIMDGGEGDDLLWSFDGNDTLRGGAGYDTAAMEGARAWFHIHYDEATARFFVTYSPGGDDYTPRGTDTLIGIEAISFYDETVLLRYGTAAADSTTRLAGGDGGDFLFGLAGNDVLDGGAGDDLMAGGLGEDTFVVHDAGDTVVENAGEGTRDTVTSWIAYALPDNVENLTLLGGGTSLDYVNATGNALNNNIVGNADRNWIDGKGGSDTMRGGLGADVYVVDWTGDRVIELAIQGNDTVYSAISYILGANVETLGLTGDDDLNGTGNPLNNLLMGTSGNNVLDGAAGADIMFGWAGDDTYIVDSVGDEVREDDGLGGGTDIVVSKVSYVLPDSVEILRLSGSAAINGTGNAGDNTIYGNASANVLDGGGGADSMYGGRGNDTYVVDSASDLVSEYVGEGIDTVRSAVNFTLGDSIENLVLTGSGNIMGFGNAARNALTGNDGINLLDGGLGADTLTGGANWDIFYFSTALGSGNIDKITDFTIGLDRFQLYTGVFAVDVDTAPYLLAARQFTIGTKATTADHRIIYNSGTGSLLYDADGTGSTAAVTFATLGRGLALDASYFTVSPTI